jgi:hypothetical protein
MTHDFERWLLTKKTNLHELATHLGGYHQAKAYLRGVGVAWENESGLLYIPKEKEAHEEGVQERVRGGTASGDKASGPQ